MAEANIGTDKNVVFPPYPTPDLVNSAIVRGSEEEAIVYSKKYGNFVDAIDSCGRTALHVAASCGKLKVVKYMLAKGASINNPDLESLYTPLHRAIYYGHVNVAVFLIMKGASMTLRDAEGLTPLELERRNRPRAEIYFEKSPRQLYVWGNNAYYTLGQVKGESIELPQRLEIFKREENYVTDIVMSKYRSVFLTFNGPTYFCGVGRNLTPSKKDNCVVTPQPRTIPGHGVLAAALGEDHSIFLTREHKIFVCGSNMYHQLGFSDCTNSNIRQLPAVPNVIGVAAAKYHSCFWTTAHLYTFGLNAGQLGHPRHPVEKTVSEPLRVTAIMGEHHIRTVATNNAAIVVAFDNGYVVCLQEFKCRAITTLDGNVLKLCCIGGSLDKEVEGADGAAQPKEELKIAVLYENGRLGIWTATSRHLCMCAIVGMNNTLIRDVCLHKEGFIVATKQYEGYAGSFRHLSDTYEVVRDQNMKRFVTRVVLDKIPFLHRVISVSCDPDGSNFAAVQYNPRNETNFVPPRYFSKMADMRRSLFDKCTEDDGLCDLVFLVGTKRIPAHAFIICQSSVSLAKIIRQKWLDRKNETGSPIITYPNNIEITFRQADPVLFRSLLAFLYCGSNDLSQGEMDVTAQAYFKSAHLGGKWQVELDKISTFAKALGISIFYHHFVKTNYRRLPVPPVEKFVITEDFLHDVQFNCFGSIVKAHKCILVSSCEYFEGMFCNPKWIEATSTTAINLPFGASAFRTFLTYLYKGTVVTINESTDINSICDVLVISHQLLVFKLQEICEQALLRFVTLKNCAELLMFAGCYNSCRLKRGVFEFMALNMTALMELRLLDDLSEDLLVELSELYSELTYLKRLHHLNNNVAHARVKRRKVYKMHPMKNWDDIANKDRIVPHRSLAPLSSLPSHEQLAKELSDNPSVLQETEDDWRKETASRKHAKGVTPLGRRYRKSFCEQEAPAPMSRTSSTCSTLSSGSDLDVYSCEERFSFFGLSERRPSALLDTTEWHRVDNKKRKSHPMLPIEVIPSFVPPAKPDLSIKESSNIQEASAPVAIPVLKRSPRTPPPSMKDNSIFPLISEFAEKQKVPSIPKMPRTSYKSFKKVSLGEIWEDIPNEQDECDKSPTTRQAWNIIEESDLTTQKYPCSLSAPERLIEAGWFDKAPPKESFCGIMEQEAVQAKTINEDEAKLSLIQLEDEAMGRLLQYYGGDYNPEEVVTVTRVSQPKSHPRWLGPH